MKKLCDSQRLHWMVVGLITLGSTLPGLGQDSAIKIIRRHPLPQGMRIVLSIPRPVMAPAASPDGRVYTKIFLEGLGAENEVGAPALPFVRYIGEVPAGVKISVATQELNEQQIQVRHPVWPQQKPRSKQPDASGLAEFIADPRAYAGPKSAIFQKAWQGQLQVRQFRKRGRDYVEIIARPFAYHLARGVVRYPRELVLDLAYVAPALSKAAGPRLGRVLVLDVRLRRLADLEHLTRHGYNFERQGLERVQVYATEAEAQALREAGFETEQVGEQSTGGAPRAKALLDDGGYHNYATLITELQQFSAAHPDLCRLSSIGQSVQGRELWAMKITTTPEESAGKPRVLLGSTLHGDEPLGTELCLRLIDLLLNAASTNSRITELLASTELWILPLLNPDGLEAHSRFNASGLDLNRSFPEGGGGGLGNPLFGPPLSAAGRPPEAASLMRFSAERRFDLAANFHTGSLVVNYPYDDDDLGQVDSPTPDDELFLFISRVYSSHNLPMWNSREFPEGIVNGAAWYVIRGGMQDWHYRYLGCNEVTIELSPVKLPLISQLDQFWEENREAMLSFIETVHTGVSGWITDGASGLPLYAAVKALSIQHPVFSDPQAGDYHRMLLPGTYDLLFTAPGYETRIVSNVVVQAGGSTRLDISLRPLALQPQRILLVTCESLRAGMPWLKAQKEAEGFSLQELVVPDGLSARQVRSAVREAYSIFPAEYILLIGDTSRIPCFAASPSTDLPYVLIDSGETVADYLGQDALLGRVTVSTTNALAEYVRKIAVFAAARAHVKDLTWVSHGYTSSEYAVAEGTHEWSITNAVPSFYTATRFYRGAGSAADLTAHINAGTDGIIYSGHGFPNQWVGYHYDTAALSGLTNFHYVPIVIAHTCQSGVFGGIGDAWLQTAARAVAYIGATADTFWDEDDILEKGEFEAMKCTAGLPIGKMLEQGLIRVCEVSPSQAEYYHTIYRVAGDPTLVMLDTPSLPLTIETGTNLPAANAAVPYTCNLRANGGTAPYKWTLVNGELPSGLMLNISSGIIRGIPAEVGVIQFTVEVQDSSPTPSVVQRAFRLEVRDLSDQYNAAVDVSNWLWNYGGEALWHIQSLTTHDEVDAAQSGPIGDGGQTWLETTVEGPGIVTFWWKVSSESIQDRLTVWLDARSVASIHGEVDWQMQHLLLAGGRHTLRWVYAKNAAISAGQDHAWLDDIRFINSVVPIITAQPQSSSLIPGDSITLRIGAFGAEPLRYQWFHDGHAVSGANRESLLLSGVHSAEAGDYMAIVSNDYGTILSSVATVTLVPGVSLAEALDNPEWVFLAEGAATWRAQNAITYDGEDAVQVTAGTNQAINMTLRTMLNGPGRVSFWLKILSSESNANQMNFLTNGVSAIEPLSGNTDWQQRSCELAPGVQELGWTFLGASGAGWIDEVQFTPAPLPPEILQFSEELAVPAGCPGTFSATAVGPQPISYQWLKNGIPISNATGPSYTLPNVQASDTGNYSLVISNAYGALTSATARLSVSRDGFLTNELIRSEPVTIPLYGPARPYPSTILLSNLAGIIENVTVTVSNLSHPFPGDLSLLLLSPDGRAVLLMQVGGWYPALDGVMLNFDDSAAVGLIHEEPILSGSYRPTSLFNDPLPKPAPDAPYGTNLSFFAGGNPNGAWKLFVYDDDDGWDKGANIGSVMGGWSLKLVTTLLKVTSPVVNQGEFRFQFPTQTGRLYTIESTHSLAEPSWRELRTLSGDGTVQTFSEQPELSSAQFYRLRVQ